MSEIFRVVGSVAGLAGLAIGLIVILFREVIRKQVFPQLARGQAYALLRMIVFLAWTIAVLGILAWVYLGRSSANEHPAGPPATALPSESTPAKAIVAGTVVDEITNRGVGQAIVSLGEEKDALVQLSEDTGNFRLRLPPSDGAAERIRLRVTKVGYRPLERSVLPPVENLVLPLRTN